MIMNKWVQNRINCAEKIALKGKIIYSTKASPLSITPDWIVQVSGLQMQLLIIKGPPLHMNNRNST